MTIKKGNVVKDKITDRKHTVGKKLLEQIEADPERYEYVCETPHADGDLSYTCFSEYCRCIQ